MRVEVKILVFIIFLAAIPISIAKTCDDGYGNPIECFYGDYATKDDFLDGIQSGNVNEEDIVWALFEEDITADDLAKRGILKDYLSHLAEATILEDAAPYDDDPEIRQKIKELFKDTDNVAANFEYFRAITLEETGVNINEDISNWDLTYGSTDPIEIVLTKGTGDTTTIKDPEGYFDGAKLGECSGENAGMMCLLIPNPHSSEDKIAVDGGEITSDSDGINVAQSIWIDYQTTNFNFQAWDMFGASFNSDGYFIRYAGMFDDGTTHFTDAYNIQRDGTTITIENGTGTTTQLNAYINFTNASGITINDSGVFFDTVQTASIIRDGKTFYIQNATNVSVTSISMTAEHAESIRIGDYLISINTSSAHIPFTYNYDIFDLFISLDEYDEINVKYSDVIIIGQRSYSFVGPARFIINKTRIVYGNTSTPRPEQDYYFDNLFPKCDVAIHLDKNEQSDYINFNGTLFVSSPDTIEAQIGENKGRPSLFLTNGQESIFSIVTDNIIVTAKNDTLYVFNSGRLMYSAKKLELDNMTLPASQNPMVHSQHITLYPKGNQIMAEMVPIELIAVYGKDAHVTNLDFDSKQRVTCKTDKLITDEQEYLLPMTYGVTGTCTAHVTEQPDGSVAVYNPAPLIDIIAVYSNDPYELSHEGIHIFRDITGSNEFATIEGRQHKITLDSRETFSYDFRQLSANASIHQYRDGVVNNTAPDTLIVKGSGFIAVFSGIEHEITQEGVRSQGYTIPFSGLTNHNPMQITADNNTISVKGQKYNLPFCIISDTAEVKKLAEAIIINGADYSALYGAATSEYRTVSGTKDKLHITESKVQSLRRIRANASVHMYKNGAPVTYSPDTIIINSQGCIAVFSTKDYEIQGNMTPVSEPKKYVTGYGDSISISGKDYGNLGGGVSLII